MSYVTAVLAGIAAATPLLTSLPHQYQALGTAIIATAGAALVRFTRSTPRRMKGGRLWRVDEEGTRVEYTIFFKVSRREKPSGLTLRVESAYSRDRVPRGRPRPPRPIRFSVIAYNTVTGKPIRQPK